MSNPRMLPDGKVTMINMGTVEKPKIVTVPEAEGRKLYVLLAKPANVQAPTQKELEAATDITDYLIAEPPC